MPFGQSSRARAPLVWTLVAVGATMAHGEEMNRCRAQTMAVTGTWKVTGGGRADTAACDRLWHLGPQGSTYVAENCTDTDYGDGSSSAAIWSANCMPSERDGRGGLAGSYAEYNPLLDVLYCNYWFVWTDKAEMTLAWYWTEETDEGCLRTAAEAREKTGNATLLGCTGNDCPRDFQCDCTGTQCGTQATMLVGDWVNTDHTDDHKPSCDKTWELGPSTATYIHSDCNNVDQWDGVFHSVVERTSCFADGRGGSYGTYFDYDVEWHLFYCNYWRRASSTSMLDVEWFWTNDTKAGCPSTLEWAREKLANGDEWFVGGASYARCDGECPEFDCACTEPENVREEAACRAQVELLTGTWVVESGYPMLSDCSMIWTLGPQGSNYSVADCEDDRMIIVDHLTVIQSAFCWPDGSGGFEGYYVEHVSELNQKYCNYWSRATSDSLVMMKVYMIHEDQKCPTSLAAAEQKTPGDDGWERLSNDTTLRCQGECPAFACECTGIQCGTQTEMLVGDWVIEEDSGCDTAWYMGPSGAKYTTVNCDDPDEDHVVTSRTEVKRAGCFADGEGGAFGAWFEWDEEWQLMYCNYWHRESSTSMVNVEWFGTNDIEGGCPTTLRMAEEKDEDGDRWAAWGSSAVACDGECPEFDCGCSEEDTERPDGGQCRRPVRISPHMVPPGYTVKRCS